MLYTQHTLSTLSHLFYLAQYMSNKTKRTLVTLLVLGLLVGAYFLLKAVGAFGRPNPIFVEYLNTEGLTKASKVRLSGVPIGEVLDIQFKEDNPNIIVVSMDIDEEIKIPRDAVAAITPDGLVGSIYISIEFEEPCSGDDCVQAGDYILGRRSGLVESFASDVSFQNTLSVFSRGLQRMADTILIDEQTGENRFRATKRDVDQVIANFKSINARAKQLTARGSRDIAALNDNVASITGNLDNRRDELTALNTNVKGFQARLGNLNVSATQAEIQRTSQKASALGERLGRTQNSVSDFTSSAGDLLRDIQSGQGSLGKFIGDSTLATGIARTQLALDLLTTDAQANTKDYYKVKVFEGKAKKRFDIEADTVFLQRADTIGQQ